MHNHCWNMDNLPTKKDSKIVGSGNSQLRTADNLMSVAMSDTQYAAKPSHERKSSGHHEDVTDGNSQNSHPGFSLITDSINLLENLMSGDVELEKFSPILRHGGGSGLPSIKPNLSKDLCSPLESLAVAAAVLGPSAFKLGQPVKEENGFDNSEIGYIQMDADCLKYLTGLSCKEESNIMEIDRKKTKVETDMDHHYRKCDFGLMPGTAHLIPEISTFDRNDNLLIDAKIKVEVNDVSCVVTLSSTAPSSNMNSVSTVVRSTAQMYTGTSRTGNMQQLPSLSTANIPPSAITFAKQQKEFNTPHQFSMVPSAPIHRQTPTRLSGYIPPAAFIATDQQKEFNTNSHMAPSDQIHGSTGTSRTGNMQLFQQSPRLSGNIPHDTFVVANQQEVNNTIPHQFRMTHPSEIHDSMRTSQAINMPQPQQPPRFSTTDIPPPKLAVAGQQKTLTTMTSYQCHNTPPALIHYSTEAARTLNMPQPQQPRFSTTDIPPPKLAVAGQQKTLTTMTSYQCHNTPPALIHDSTEAARTLNMPQPQQPRFSSTDIPPPKIDVTGQQKTLTTMTSYQCHMIPPPLIHDSTEAAARTLNMPQPRQPPRFSSTDILPPKQDVPRRQNALTTMSSYQCQMTPALIHDHTGAARTLIMPLPQQSPRLSGNIPPAAGSEKVFNSTSHCNYTGTCNRLAEEKPGQLPGLLSGMLGHNPSPTLRVAGKQGVSTTSAQHQPPVISSSQISNPVQSTEIFTCSSFAAENRCKKEISEKLQDSVPSPTFTVEEQQRVSTMTIRQQSPVMISSQISNPVQSTKELVEEHPCKMESSEQLEDSVDAKRCEIGCPTSSRYVKNCLPVKVVHRKESNEELHDSFDAERCGISCQTSSRYVKNLLPVKEELDEFELHDTQSIGSQIDTIHPILAMSNHGSFCADDPDTICIRTEGIEVVNPGDQSVLLEKILSNSLASLANCSKNATMEGNLLQVPQNDSCNLMRIERRAIRGKNPCVDTPTSMQIPSKNHNGSVDRAGNTAVEQNQQQEDRMLVSTESRIIRVVNPSDGSVTFTQDQISSRNQTGPGDCSINTALEGNLAQASWNKSHVSQSIEARRHWVVNPADSEGLPIGSSTSTFAKSQTSLVDSSNTRQVSCSSSLEQHKNKCKVNHVPDYDQDSDATITRSEDEIEPACSDDIDVDYCPDDDSTNSVDSERQIRPSCSKNMDVDSCPEEESTYSVDSHCPILPIGSDDVDVDHCPYEEQTDCQVFPTPGSDSEDCQILPIPRTCTVEQGGHPEFDVSTNFLTVQNHWKGHALSNMPGNYNSFVPLTLGSNLHQSRLPSTASTAQPKQPHVPYRPGMPAQLKQPYVLHQPRMPAQSRQPYVLHHQQMLSQPRQPYVLHQQGMPSQPRQPYVLRQPHALFQQGMPATATSAQTSQSPFVHENHHKNISDNIEGSLRHNRKIHQQYIDGKGSAPCVPLSIAQCHTKPDDYWCEECDLVLKTREAVEAHLITHERKLPNAHKLLNVSCNICKLVYQTKLRLLRHKIVTHGPFLLLLKLKKKPPKRKEQYIKKKKTYLVALSDDISAGETDAEERAPLPLQPRKFICAKCDLFVEGTTQMINHMKLHENDASLKVKSKQICNICEESYPTLLLLLKHRTYCHSGYILCERGEKESNKQSKSTLATYPEKECLYSSTLDNPDGNQISNEEAEPDQPMTPQDSNSRCPDGAPVGSKETFQESTLHNSNHGKHYGVRVGSSESNHGSNMYPSPLNGEQVGSKKVIQEANLHDVYSGQSDSGQFYSKNVLVEVSKHDSSLRQPNAEQVSCKKVFKESTTQDRNSEQPNGEQDCGKEVTKDDNIPEQPNGIILSKEPTPQDRNYRQPNGEQVDGKKVFEESTMQDRNLGQPNGEQVGNKEVSQEPSTHDNNPGQLSGTILSEEPSSHQDDSPQLGNHQINSKEVAFELIQHNAQHFSSKTSTSAGKCRTSGRTPVLLDENLSLQAFVNKHRTIVETRFGNVYTCKFCPGVISYRDNTQFEIHMKQHHPKWDIICPCCQLSFSTFGLLQIHLPKCIQEHDFLCHFCGKKYLNKRKFTQHRRQHEKQFEKKHQKSKPAYCCEICQKAYHSIERLRFHVGRVHDSNKIIRHHCSKCSKSFLQLHQLNTHLLTHDKIGERPFTCSVCDKAFKQLHHMQNHLATHSDNFDYPCTVCNKKFRMKHHLASHMRQHTGNMFECKYCEKKISSKAHLNIHLRDQHPEKADFYTCKICNEEFSKLKALNQHILLAHTANTSTGTEANQLDVVKKGSLLKCDQCGARFTKKHRILHHMETVHLTKDNPGQGETMGPGEQPACSELLSGKTSRKAKKAGKCNTGKKAGMVVNAGRKKGGKAGQKRKRKPRNEEETDEDSDRFSAQSHIGEPKRCRTVRHRKSKTLCKIEENGRNSGK